MLFARKSYAFRPQELWFWRPKAPSDGGKSGWGRACVVGCLNVNSFRKVRQWLQSLSFRTGVIVLACCIPFYILSFAQMLLPISAAAKGILWTVLFGLAKTFQYGGITILGVEGYKRLKSKFKKNS